MLKANCCIILSAVLLGCMPLGARLFYQAGGNPESLVLFRFLLAPPFLLPSLWWGRRKGPSSLKISWRRGGQILLLSTVGTALTPLCLFHSYRFISSGAATTIHFVYPILVVLGSRLFFKEPVSRLKWICVFFSAVGIALFYTPGNGQAIQGGFLALFSGGTYAFYILYLERSGLSNLSPSLLSLYISVCAAAALFLYGWISGTLYWPDSWKIWLLLVGFSFTTGMLTTILFQIGLSRAGSQQAALLSTFEPVTSILTGVLFFQETLSFRTAVGILCVLASILLLTACRRWES